MTDLDTLDTLIRKLDQSVTTPATAWTLAQSLAHCAQSIEYSLVGYPKLRSGLFRATIGPLAKRKFIRARRMKHDLKAQIAGAPEITPHVTFDDARQRALAAIERFRAHTGELSPHLAYGPCTKDEYATLHLLHVEDHLRGLGLGLA